MREDNDRERILCNIAAMLAHELSMLQNLPAVQQYMQNKHSSAEILCSHDFFHKQPHKKGELVVCWTSTGRQQNPFLISLVEEQGIANDPNGLLLRAIGTDQLSSYGNESFIRIVGIPERLLWEGIKREFSVKLSKALSKLDTYIHRFRGLEFASDDTATVWFGEIWGGLSKKTKPYSITVKFTKKTTIKAIIQQLEEQGFGKREFEAEDGKDDAPFGNPKAITRADLVGSLSAAGIELKKDITT